MPVLRLHIGAMGCRRCVREVSALLRDVAGVRIVTAEARGKTVTIVGEMTTEQVLAAFGGTPYRPRLIEVAAED
jgi:copper chaperone CopZ